MFFYLSKILTFLISPTIWIVFFITYSLFTKIKIRKKRSLIIGVLMFFFFSNSFILSLFQSTIEVSPVKYESLENSYTYGIVLGGLATYDNIYERVIFHPATDRLMQALDLYKRGKIEKILISGGSGAVIYKEKKEADILKNYLIKIGISKDDIIIESKSKNTHENALFTSKILAANNESVKYLLISSSLHILRAQKCFEKEGTPVDIFPTNYKIKQFNTVGFYVIPSAEALSNWNMFIHEIIGLITYKISGYI